MDRKQMGKLALLIAFGLVLYWVLMEPAQAGKVLNSLASVFLPFLLGGCLAFLLNVPMTFLERGWRRAFAQKHEGARRPLCLLGAVMILGGIVFAVFFVVVPSLRDSVVSFAALLPERLANLENLWNRLIAFLGDHSIQLPAFSLDAESIQSRLSAFLSQYGQDFLNATISLTSSFFSLIVNLVLAFVFSLYLLSQKETLIRQCTHVIQAFLSEKWAGRVIRVARLTNETFYRFVTGQLTEAVILGCLCFVGMLLLRLPYAGVIAVLVGFTALIPIFGAVIGVIVGTILILLADPVKALWFIVFFVILQQVEGNVIYPRVVGQSVGLPGLWVLAAVTLGGNLFGLVGMILSVPLCSVLYTLARQLVHKRLAAKGPKAAPTKAPPEASAKKPAEPPSK